MAAIPAFRNSRTARLRLGKPLAALGRLARAGAQVAIRPHKAALANLAQMPLYVAGLGCVDYAAYHVGAGWGWLVTGVSLVVLEHAIADED